MRDLDVLGTDHVEIAFYHSTEPAEPGQEQVYEDFLRLKEAGAVKFLGLTSHGAVPEVMEAGLQTGWYDVLMPAYNPGNAAEVDPILERAAEQGVGGMVMKSLRGGGGRPSKYGECSPEALDNHLLVGTDRWRRGQDGSVRQRLGTLGGR